MGSVITGILVGVVVATIGAVVNYIASARRDEQRRKHELEMLEQR